MKYLESFKMQYKNTDAFTAKAIVEEYDGVFVIQNPPEFPLSQEEMDYLKKVENDLGRKLTDSEVFGFAQINSEHCRHFGNGIRPFG